MIGGGEPRVDLENILAIIQWPIPTNLTTIRSFMGATQYLRKFNQNLSKVATPLIYLIDKGKKSHWGKPQKRELKELKRKINDAPVFAMPNLQRPFELETNASGYELGALLMQEGRPMCYHSELFHGAVLDYPTYDKELFAIVHEVKKWKHYLLGKETIIHIEYQPLQYLQSQGKM
jgi:hypothetical protein